MFLGPGVTGWLPGAVEQESEQKIEVGELREAKAGGLDWSEGSTQGLSD